MMKLNRRSAAALALLTATSVAPAVADPAVDAAPAQPIELVVVVHGTHAGGVVNWALYADERQHESGEQMRGGRQDAAGATTLVMLGAIEPGRYSIAMFLDEDSDGECDRSFLGLPKEPFGFSNDVMGTMGKPSFEQASFEVGSTGARIEMTLTEL